MGDSLKEKKMEEMLDDLTDMKSPMEEIMKKKLMMKKMGGDSFKEN